MRTIGLLGGMSWESTALYYRYLNEGVRDRLGALHSARIAMISVDFHEIEVLQAAGDWDGAGRALAREARALERAGAEAIVLCTNTMHRVADAIEAAVDVPLLHLADATAGACLRAGARTVLLLGTRFTMEQAFYRERLERAGLRVVTPDEDGRATVHRIIYDELCLGLVEEPSRAAVAEIVQRVHAATPVDGVIEGCTEIGMLHLHDLVPLPLFDTTKIHADEALAWALA